MSKRKWLFGVAALALIAIAVLIRGHWTDGCAAALAAARRTRGAGRDCQRRAQEGAGAARRARHRHPDRQRRPQGARRHQHHRRAFQRRRAASSKATCCSPSTAAPSRRRSRRPKAPSRATRPSSTAPQRDVARYTDLVAKGATPIVNLDNAKTQARRLPRRHQVRPGPAGKSQGAARLLHRHARRSPAASAPPTSRSAISCARPTPTPMATIIQMAPVYVSFTVPQKNLPDIRKAIAAEDRDGRGRRSRARTSAPRRRSR